MVPLLNTVRSALATPRGGRPVCIVCGHRVSGSDRAMRLRGGLVVHRDCATYDMRRRRTGSERLGYPYR
jgi:hypothetical protein